MEGKLNSLPETKSDVSTSGGSTEKPSKTQLVEYDSGSNSSPSTRPESHTRNITLEVVELSSDDDVEIVDVKRQKGSKSPEHGQEQQLSGRSSPKDLTCSVCLGEYDNKAFLDKCFRILLLVLTYYVVSSHPPPSLIQCYTSITHHHNFVSVAWVITICQNKLQLGDY